MVLLMLRIGLQRAEDRLGDTDDGGEESGADARREQAPHGGSMRTKLQRFVES